MKKTIVLVFIMGLVFSFLGCGAGTNYYFLFGFETITCKVGDSVNVFEQDYSSNISNYAQLHIYSSDDSVVEVFGYSFKAKKVGKCTITLAGVVDNNLISDNFEVEVKSFSDYYSQDEEEDLTGELLVKNYVSKVKNGYSVATFDVYLKEEAYFDFTYQIKDGIENVLDGPTRFSNQIEIYFITGTNVEIVVYNKTKTMSVEVVVS